MPRTLFIPLILLPATPLGAQIFADFETSAGDFTCELAYENSPKSVANFIGLAEGSRTWIDPATGAVKSGQPFYNGVTFHRVIEGFMNQAGSKNGLGTDGPGYRFRDEFPNGLTHSEAYLLSMANAGAHTNGSQFFITVDSTPWLDNAHTVFGKVTSGTGVIDAINSAEKLPASTPSVPVSPVVIEDITIRRVGEAAEAFDIHAQNLPVVLPAKGRLEVTPGVQTAYVLSDPQPPSSVLQVHRSENLSIWSRLGERLQGSGSSGPTSLTFDNAQASRAFYQASLTHYYELTAPHTTSSRTLIVTLDGEQRTLTFNTSGNGGSYLKEGVSRVISHLNYTPSLFKAEWVLSAPDALPFAVVAVPMEETATHITGTHDAYEHNGSAWQHIGSGTFSLTK